MAIIINKQPSSDFNPVYNDIVYQVESSNKNNLGFRYIAQIKDLSDNLLFEKTVIPELGTGVGNIHLDRELSDFVDFYFSPSIVNAVGSANPTHINYKVEFGEEYFENWEWEDFFFVPNTFVSTLDYNPDNLINATSLVVKKTTGSEPPFAIGDKIFVTLNSGTQDRPQIQGVQEVLFVDEQTNGGIQYYRVILNLGWVGSGTSTGGSARYADNRKSRFLAENTELDNETAFNGVVGFARAGFNVWDSQEYRLANPFSKALTQLYDGYKVRENRPLYINFRQTLSSIGEFREPDKIRFYNDSGEIYEFTIPVSGVRIRTINVGTSRTDFGTLMSGSGALIKPTTKEYSFEFLGEAGNIASKRYYITIDKSCPVSELVEIQYMDKLGSVLPWYFTLMNVETHSIKRSSYTKLNGTFAAEKWENRITRGGNEIYNSEFETEFILRTDFLNDRDAKYFHNVVESPVTFFYQEEGDQNVRCTIETNSVEVKKEKWFELKRYEIRVKLSNSQKINI